MDEERRCDLVSCRKPLERKEGETAQNFQNRKHCDKSCAAISGNQKRRLGHGVQRLEEFLSGHKGT